jgi:anaerobic selenocysteine-containing dehydrogenase
MFLRICEAITRSSGRERTGALCYAVGWTHHVYGVQIICAASIIQGLLGTIGRPVVVSLHCAGIAASRAALTFQRCTTCCRHV